MRHILPWGLVLFIGGFIGQASPYRLYVASESGDIVSQVVFDGTRATVARQVAVGVMPADVDGPHNVAVSPDGRYWYVTIAHGTPYGSLWKLAVDGDSVVGRAPLEMFPTTIALTPDGELAFVANSDFHGDHPRTNVVSVVHTPTMTALANLPACDMPHGVKVNHAGTRVYVSCMMSDEILEMDRQSFRVLRRQRTATEHSGPAHECSPTFVSLSPDDARLYLACNHGNTLQVRSAETLNLIREIPVGAGAYNVEPSPDGRWVIVTNKKARSVSLIDARTLAEVARIETSKSLPHGVAYAPDGRYAFISVESVGVDPGAVDVIDLMTRTRVASVPVPLQPTGISLWVTR